VVRSCGLLAAFSGVVIAFSDELSLPSAEALIGDTMSVFAAAAWAATIIVIKVTALRTASAEKVLLYQLAVAAVMQLALAPFFGPFIREVTPLVLGAFAFQVVIVVAITYVVWFWLIRQYQASQLSTFTFLTPLFGVLFGGLLLSEPISPRLLVALALVAAGIYLVNRPRRGRGL
jgi:drug/metabolite transporter (DMT)-like permease